MSLTPREIGTLIAVVLKARHLPNKRHIGKQDPYCVVILNGEKRRTRAVKRGGQHPEWDEELRFTLYENVEDVLARTADGAGTPPPPPPKTTTLPERVKGGKTMNISCYADDPREPDFIGECAVDLTEVLTKGETDEWFTLLHKDKYCGEVYLELTFWSNEPPPEKKSAVPKVNKANKQYGGPGSFVPSGDLPSTLSAGQFSHIRSSSGAVDHSRQGSVPSSLRSSNSLATLDLYTPPYERANETTALDHIVNDFGEMGVSDLHRRESFPPSQSAYPPQSSSILTPTNPVSYEQSRYTDSESIYVYDRSQTPQVTTQHGNNRSGSTVSYSTQSSYHLPYETAPTAYPSTMMRPRIGIPTSSSGFIPLQSHPSSGYTPLSPHQTESTGFVPFQGPSSSFTSLPSHGSHLSDSSGFAPPPSQTPAPQHFHTSQYSQHPGFAPAPTPASPAFVTPAVSFQPSQTFVPSSSFQFSQYTTPQSAVVSHQYVTSQPPGPAQLPLSGSQPLQQIYSAATPPPHEIVPHQVQQLGPSSNNGPGSRPLPQPQVHGQQQVQYQASLQSQPPVNQPQQLPYNPAPTPYQPSSTPLSTPPVYQPIPPPPPPLSINSFPQQSVMNNHQNTTLSVPPPPPPPPLMSNNSLSRRPALPQPPQGYQTQQAVFQHIPAPPPPPPNFPQSNTLPPPPPQLRNVSQTYYQNSPAQQTNHAQWLA